MIILDKPQKYFIYQGKKIKLKLWFKNVLKCYALLKDDIFNDVERITIMYDLLCKSRHKFEIKQKFEIVETVFKEFINSNEKTVKENQRPTFDIVYDQTYLYSSFMHQYNIDLQNKKLWWSNFLALFDGLDKNTKIMKVIEIRSKPLPKRNKHNGEYIMHLQKQKMHYALEKYYSDEEREKHANDSKLKFFKMLESIAKSN